MGYVAADPVRPGRPVHIGQGLTPPTGQSRLKVSYRLVWVTGGEGTPAVSVLAFEEPGIEFGFADGQGIPTGTMAEPVRTQRFAKKGQVALQRLGRAGLGGGSWSQVSSINSSAGTAWFAETRRRKSNARRREPAMATGPASPWTASSPRTSNSRTLAVLSAWNCIQR